MNNIGDKNVYKSIITSDTLITIEYLRQISCNDPKVDRVIRFLEREISNMPVAEEVTYSDNMKATRAIVILKLFMDTYSDQGKMYIDDINYCLEKINKILIDDEERKR